MVVIAWCRYGVELSDSSTNDVWGELNKSYPGWGLLGACPLDQSRVSLHDCFRLPPPGRVQFLGLLIETRLQVFNR